MERRDREGLMKAVDTNVLLRYILNDDGNQFAISSSFLKARTVEDPAFVSHIVLCELTWTLRRRYGYSAMQTAAVVAALFETAEIAIEDEAEISPLLSNAAPGADIADILISFRAKRSGCDVTVSFDRHAAKTVPGMELLA